MKSKSRQPTIVDVARLAEVSIDTVSRVLNGTVPVEPEKPGHVRRAMEELLTSCHVTQRGCWPANGQIPWD